MQNNRKKMLGFSLLEIMIGLGISATALYYIQDRLGDSMKAGKRVGLMHSKQAAEQFLATHVSCAKSDPSASCSPNMKMNLKDANGVVIVHSASGRRMGEWTIGAFCNTDGNGIIAKVAWIKPNKTLVSAYNETEDFFPDPLTKKPLNWSNIMAPLLDGENICPSKTGSQTSWCAMGENCSGDAILCISLSTNNLYYKDILYSVSSSMWSAPGGACDGGVLVRQ